MVLPSLLTVAGVLMKDASIRYQIGGPLIGLSISSALVQRPSSGATNASDFNFDNLKSIDSFMNTHSNIVVLGSIEQIINGLRQRNYLCGKITLFLLIISPVGF